MDENDQKNVARLVWQLRKSLATKTITFYKFYEQKSILDCTRGTEDLVDFRSHQLQPGIWGHQRTQARQTWTESWKTISLKVN